MNPTPKISIVIPVYNGSNFLRQAIDSALAQTYSNIEIIVVNDGSNDGGETERIALSYKNKIRYFSKENGGVASALNRAIAEMSGEFFSWLSHDDLYYPNKIETQIEALDGMESAKTILYSDFAIFSDNPNIIREIRLPHVPHEQFKFFLVTNFVHGCSLLIPREAFTVCGTFNEQLRATQDYELWFRMAKEFSFIHIPEVLVKFRNHQNQGTHTMGSIVLAECDDLYSKFIHELDPQEIMSASATPLAESYGEIASRMFSRGLNAAGILAADYARQNSTPVATITRDIRHLGIRLRYLANCLFENSIGLLPSKIKIAIKTGIHFVMHLR